MRIKKEDVRRILLQFSTTAVTIGIFLFLLLIMAIINGYLSGQIESATSNTLAILDGDIEVAKSIVVTDEVLTNIDNVHYDPERCRADDSAMFATLKPVISYENADMYNNARQSVMNETKMDLFNDIFPSIDYKEGTYLSEEQFGNKSFNRYHCKPSSFNSCVTGIVDDRYDYVAFVSVEVTEPTMYLDDEIHMDYIVISYSTTASGKIDYSTVHGMRCTGRSM